MRISSGLAGKQPPSLTSCSSYLLTRRTSNSWEHYEVIPRSILRPVLLGAVRGLAFFQRWFCLPRRHPYVRTPSAPNPKTGLFNFPDYTYETTPYYVVPTLKNQWGPWAILNRLRGIAVPGPEYDSQGIAWEAMGARRPTAAGQEEAEARVRKQAELLKEAPWGYRANVPFQPRPLVKPLGPGYGSREYAFPDDVEPYPADEYRSKFLSEKEKN